MCAANVLESSCIGNGDDGAFTQFVLATPVNVVAGQIIQVTVVISFS
jgi:hypothetical protein